MNESVRNEGNPLGSGMQEPEKYQVTVGAAEYYRSRSVSQQRGQQPESAHKNAGVDSHTRSSSDLCLMRKPPMQPHSCRPRGTLC
jgi:hypothetical protein